MSEKEVKAIDFELKEEAEGKVSAVFSVFNSLDSDGDVVLPGSIKSGFKSGDVPMVWAHKWDMPIGKGRIKEDDGKATFDGEFFMDTDSGQEAYKIVKNMGDMQQWSFGYKVNDSEFGKTKDDGGDDTNARYLKDLTVYEVSPVLVGANQDTYTLAIKSNTELLKELASDPEEGSEDECCGSCEGKSAKKYGDDEDEMKGCKYHDGGPCMKMEEDKKEMKSEEDLEVSQEDSKSFSEEVKDVLAALDDLVARAKAISMLRGDDGRKLGVKATEALRAVADDLNDAWTEIDEFIGNVGTEGALELEVEEELVEDEPAETEEVAEASTDTIDVETEVEEVTEEEVAAEPVVAEPEDEAAEEDTPEDNTDSSDEEFDAEWIRAQQIIAESLAEEIDEV